MSRSDEQRVQDILDASDQILDVVRDGRDAWEKDRFRQLAVERLLEIIGESANSLTDGFRAQYPDIAWRDIIGLRIVLAHHYHRVDPNQVWVIAQTEVERLAERLRTDRRD
ncbi:MAG TPA: HepT-like ribonuclease domain-containing protein [Trebonia sp.]